MRAIDAGAPLMVNATWPASSEPLTRSVARVTCGVTLGVT